MKFPKFSRSNPRPYYKITEKGLTALEQRKFKIPYVKAILQKIAEEPGLNPSRLETLMYIRYDVDKDKLYTDLKRLEDIGLIEKM